MRYLVTWSEGDEVAYLILGEKDLCRLGMDDKNYIITEFSWTH